MECQKLLDNGILVCLYWALVLVLLLMVFFELRKHNVRAMLTLAYWKGKMGSGESSDGGAAAEHAMGVRENMKPWIGGNRLENAMGVREHAEDPLMASLAGGSAYNAEHLVFVEHNNDPNVDPAAGILSKIGAGF